MADTRDRILDAAAHVMRTRGFARTTTREIARAAGYSEATLYKHFQDKTDLFLAVLKERLPSLRGTLGALSAGIDANAAAGESHRQVELGYGTERIAAQPDGVIDELDSRLSGCGIAAAAGNFGEAHEYRGIESGAVDVLYCRTHAFALNAVKIVRAQVPA